MLQAELSASDCWSVDELLTPPAETLDGTGAVIERDANSCVQQ